MTEQRTLEQYLADLKEGDTIYRQAGANTLERARVARLTATQIVLNTGGRYNRTTGASIGSSAGWSRSFIKLPTPALIAEHQKLYLDRWASNSLPKIFKSLSTAQQANLFKQIKDLEAANAAGSVD